MPISSFDPCISLPLVDKELCNVIESGKDWALMHGAGLRDRKTYSKDYLQFAPFVLLPSPFPRKEFTKSLELQTLFNELIHKVAHDEVFLEQTLKSIVAVDDFTANLHDVWVKVRQQGIAQPVSLGIVRSDIMLDQNAEQRQVEINCIACGFGHFGPLSREIHRYIVRKLGHCNLVDNMPTNAALSGICGALIEAYDLYGASNAVILFVVEEVLYNISDERFHEFEITDRRPDIQIIKMTLTEIEKQARLNSKNQLIIEQLPVAVVYYRSGYAPSHYPSRREWEARLSIEISNAIKCPPIHYQLAGTKKVQQTLAARGVLERFMGENAGKLREVFTGIYSLDFDDDGDKAVEMALGDPERFVLKPQREGGGNNIYGLQIKDKLIQIRHSPERAAYILMDRIRPPLVSGYVIRPGRQMPPLLTNLVSELGIFGVIIGTKDKILSNRQVGHMMRTKSADANEAGIFAGYGALDSPYLID